MPATSSRLWVHVEAGVAAAAARGFEQNVKDIIRPVRVYALRAEAVVKGLKRQIVEI